MANRKLKENLVWVDLETTDIGIEGNELLEVGMILTDKKLRILSEINVVIKSDFDWDGPNVVEVVKEMHTNSGLIEEGKSSALTFKAAEAKILGWLISNNAINLPMAGSTVHFDRYWLRARMPAIEELFHYRNFDVTTLRAFFDISGGKTPHRALLDLQHDITQTRTLLETLGLSKVWKNS